MLRATAILMSAFLGAACGGPDHAAAAGDAFAPIDVAKICGDTATLVNDEDPPVLSGSCDISTADQVVRLNLAKISRVIGVIWFDPANDLNVDFNYLENVDELVVTRRAPLGTGPGTHIARFPALQTVKELAVVDNVALSVLEVPALQTVTESATFARNSHFSSCDADAIIAQLREPPPEIALNNNCDACCR